MATTYQLRSDDSSDITGDYRLNTSSGVTPTARTASITRGGNYQTIATWISDANDPGMLTWSTIASQLSGQMNVTNAYANCNIQVVVERVTSDAATSRVSVTSGAVSAATTGNKAISFSGSTSFDNGGWASTDRLRVTVQAHNTNSTGGGRTIGVNSGSTDSYVVTPYTKATPLTKSDAADSFATLWGSTPTLKLWHGLAKGEQFGLSDNKALLLAHLKSITTDGLIWSDAKTVALGLRKAVIDQFGFGDTYNVVIAGFLGKVITGEIVLLTDNAKLQLNVLKNNIADSFSFGDDKVVELHEVGSNIILRGRWRVF